ncbi:unnamed protein product [Caenorhabditis angaria]|uniref:CID domain-containing protein n=1 Tax=Caenorhabditis angaria TaxID=860376 RepID=A0A9P1IGK0_9PELO|nr:unnamed protein product [Caenorhabditis angaria]
MSKLSDEANEYKLTLSELNNNNKTQINLLTILADDYKKCAAQIVDIIAAALMTANPQKKLVIMYVTDSILKNVKGVYIDLFNKQIIPMFLNAFQAGDEKIRTKLYSLKLTWGISKIFLPSKLYQLDIAVNKIDAAWPVANPKTGEVLKNDPNVRTRPPPSTPPTPSGTGNAKVFVNRKFIQNDAKVQPNTIVPPRKIEEKAMNNSKVKKENASMDPLDKLLPSSRGSMPPPVGPAPKRKSDNLPTPIPPKRKIGEADEDLRNRDMDLRKQKATVAKPTQVAGSHAFAVTPSLPVPIKQEIAPPVAPQPPVIISSDEVKLDVPQNNRIFVDGKAYEVMFIDDIAVIERAGAPHRIFFAGEPRHIVIDGVMHPIRFGETKKIDIDGTIHNIKFGAPGRELYLGSHPFKAQFGGTGIVATINGIRHEIRLTGSAPEVRIDPDPAYHLARFMLKMKEQKTIEIKAPKPKPIEDPFNLLKKLQRSGYLKPSQPIEPPRPRFTPISTAPIVSPTTIATIEKERKAVAPSLKEFRERDFKIRYDNVIKNLLKKRENSCQYCGMRMDGISVRSKAWTDHMDWHVKLNLAKQDTSKHRLWYPTPQNWPLPKSARIEAEQQSSTNENESEEEKPSTVAGVVSEGQKDCAICHEKFEEYYDHDEETWRLKNTVIINGKVVHVTCSSDASLMETPTPTSAPTSMDFPISKMDIKSEMLLEDDSSTEVKPIVEQKSIYSI